MGNFTPEEPRDSVIVDEWGARVCSSRMGERSRTAEGQESEFGQLGMLDLGARVSLQASRRRGVGSREGMARDEWEEMVDLHE